MHAIPIRSGNGDFSGSSIMLVNKAGKSGFTITAVALASAGTKQFMVMSIKKILRARYLPWFNAVRVLAEQSVHYN